MNALLAFLWPFSPSLSERLGWVLVHSLWQFALVALVAGVAVRAMRQNAATTRYGVLVSAMALSVALPVATWMLQPSDAPNHSASLEALALAPAQESSSAISPRAEASPLTSPPQLPDTEMDARTPDLAASNVASEGRSEVSRDSAAVLPPPSSWSERAQMVLRPWLTWIVVGWSLGVVLCSARPLLGWHTLRRLQREGLSPVPDETLAALRRVLERIGLRRAVRVMQSSLAQVPILVGYARPAILLPISLVTSLPAAQLEAILAHELAHVRRHDFVVNLLQTLAETLFFYHPAVWWLSRQIRVEREHCCDDLVVALLGNRLEYGRALVAIEQLRGQSTVLALGASDGSMLSRVRRIVGVDREGFQSAAARGGNRWSILCLGAICTLLALIAFRMSIEAAAAQRGQPPAAPEKKEPPKQDKEGFTAWGKEVGGLQAGLGYHPGQKRAYSHGETVKLVVRVRNVGKQAVKFHYLRQFFIENSPNVTDGEGKPVPLEGLTAFGIHIPVEVNLAPGKEIELYELKRELRSANSGIDGFSTLYGTGKFQIQYERVFGNSSSGSIKLNPALSKLATGELELEIKSSAPAATGVTPPPKLEKERDMDLAGLEGKWDLISEEHDGKKRDLSFKSYQFTFKGKEVTTAWVRDVGADTSGDDSKSSGGGINQFVIDSTKNPKELTITGDNLKIQAVYKLEKDYSYTGRQDILTIAHFGKPEDARPKGFTAADAAGEGRILVVQVLKRADDKVDAKKLIGNVTRPDLTGRVVGVSENGKFTVEGVATERPAQSVMKIELKIGEKTAITYDGVTTNGAKPTVGYAVSVWMDNWEKGLVARVGFGGSEGGNRGYDLIGTVVGVDKDGKGIELEVPAVRGVEKKKERFRFDDKTVLAFSDVAEGKAEIAVNQTAWVLYDNNARVAGNRIAGKVQFFGSALPRFNRGEDSRGKLITMTDKSLTIEQPVGPLGGEPKRMVLKLGEKCSLVYHNVGPGGANRVAGQHAQVWFEKGSKETAAEVALSGEVRERWTTIRGKVVGVSPDGATITLEQPSAVRGENPKRVEMKLTPQTRIGYSNVGPDGAKPTVGYMAQMLLIDGSKDTASHVTFTKHSVVERGR